MNIYIRIPTTELYSSFRSANLTLGYLYASEIEHSLKNFKQIWGTGKNRKIAGLSTKTTDIYTKAFCDKNNMRQHISIFLIFITPPS